LVKKFGGLCSVSIRFHPSSPMCRACTIRSFRHWLEEHQFRAAGIRFAELIFLFQERDVDRAFSTIKALTVAKSKVN